jgi:hypothetical protein
MLKWMKVMMNRTHNFNFKSFPKTRKSAKSKIYFYQVIWSIFSSLLLTSNKTEYNELSNTCKIRARLFFLKFFNISINGLRKRKKPRKKWLNTQWENLSNSLLTKWRSKIQPLYLYFLLTEFKAWAFILISTLIIRKFLFPSSKNLFIQKKFSWKNYEHCFFEKCV